MIRGGFELGKRRILPGPLGPEWGRAIMSGGGTVVGNVLRELVQERGRAPRYVWRAYVPGYAAGRRQIASGSSLDRVLQQLRIEARFCGITLDEDRETRDAERERGRRG